MIAAQRQLPPTPIRTRRLLTNQVPHSHSPPPPALTRILVMVADIKVPVQLGPSFLLQLPRFPCLVRAYPSFLSFPKPSTITIPIIVAADGRFPHRYAPGTQVQLKAEMSSEAVDGYILLFAEEIEETDEPSTIQELFIFGKVISKGGRVAGHFSIDAITAQPDSLIIR